MTAARPAPDCETEARDATLDPFAGFGLPPCGSAAPAILETTAGYRVRMRQRERDEAGRQGQGDE